MKNTVCKKCGTKFHYCTSCDHDPCRYNGYCSDECWEQGEEHSDIKKRTIDFYSSLPTDEQRRFFKDVCEEIDEDYLYKMIEWIEKYEKELGVVA